MALNPQARAELVNGYTRVLITAWSSEEYSNKLATDPRTALAEAGLVIPADGEIEIVRTIPEGQHDGNLEDQVQLWEIGVATGHYEFHIPDTPQVDTAELSEEDLDSIAGGMDINCCCCPCSCCT